MVIGIDTVVVPKHTDGRGFNDKIGISNVEFVRDAFSNDHDIVNILATGSQATDGLITLNNIEEIHGTSIGDAYQNQDPAFKNTIGNDNINADSAGGVIWLDGETGNDKLVVGNGTPSRTTVAGGYNDDDITVRASQYALVFGDLMSAGYGETITPAISRTSVPSGTPAQYQSANPFEGPGHNGEDNINVTLVGVGSQALVYGQGGNDKIDVNTSLTSNNSAATVYGGTGEDIINVSNMWGAVIRGIGGVYIDGGDAKDTITSTNNLHATVLGGAGDDTIKVTTATGGDASVIGGTGNDTITISSDITAHVTIDGGAGNDTIVLTDSKGTDTLVFGNIDYSVTQTVLEDTQGTDPSPAIIGKIPSTVMRVRSTRIS